MTTDTYEIYDHLADRETLIVYMTKHEGESVSIDGSLLTVGRCTRILQDSYDFRPVHKRQVKIGERLTVSATIGGKVKARTIPTDWVVTETETYEPKNDIPGFREIVIAYCEQVPLSLDEFRKAIYETGVVVSLDSFGGDEEAYQKYLKSSKATANSNGNVNAI
ncbi:hypothetical protein NIES4071_56240 [Calothrix sp. NIES-4071]|nr:hypothetical protein NIES4071_56240 [Calothrix sp. NIES-4071]BAZ59931.1 hypothetical protein NIES4105_56190 [Calothrix sp. NIES-4105]